MAGSARGCGDGVLLGMLIGPLGSWLRLRRHDGGGDRRTARAIMDSVIIVTSSVYDGGDIMTKTGVTARMEQ